MPFIGENAAGIRYGAGAPVAGTNKVDTLTIGGTPTGGTFRLSLGGIMTAAIPWNATNATLLSAMNGAMDAAWGAGSVVATAGTLTAGIGTILLTFGGAYARRSSAPIAVADNSLTGTSPTLANAETTPGVNATERGCAVGTLYINTSDGSIYSNTGTSTQPTWTSR